MKIALCQMEVVAKRPDLNAKSMIRMLEEAAAAEADLACFNELCIPGYMIGDTWEDSSFLQECATQQDVVRKAAVDLGIRVLFGNVQGSSDLRKVLEDGRPVRHNSAIMLNKSGKAVINYHKTNLANYREFEDKRYFAKGSAEPEYARISEGTTSVWISTSICEDGWDNDYPDKPIMNAYAEYGYRVAPHVHVNLSCSPFTKGKNAARNRRFAEHSNLFSALCYVNCVGIQNNGKNVFVFDGSTTVYREGLVLGALPALRECIGYVEVQGKNMNLLEGPWETSQKDPTLSDVLVYGTKKFLEQNGLSRVVIGLSGGIDSAVSAMIHVKALGAQNVVLVNMPTEYNSDTTKGIARTIAANLGCPYMVVPIGNLCDGIESAIGNALYGASLPMAYAVDAENIAARMRGAGIQAALAAGLKAVFPNNGNKSETSVGYCTMMGDHAGYLAPLADLWKYEVYEIARELSDSMGGILPEGIFTLKPSAELSAAHNVDEGKGDPLVYWYHDRLFASWMEPWEHNGITGSIVAYAEGMLLMKLGIHSEENEKAFRELFPTHEAFIKDIERWWSLFTGIAVVKRVQSPPILVVSRRAYGYDYRESLGSQGYTTRYLETKERLLQGVIL